MSIWRREKSATGPEDGDQDAAQSPADEGVAIEPPDSGLRSDQAVESHADEAPEAPQDLPESAPPQPSDRPVLAAPASSDTQERDAAHIERAFVALHDTAEEARRQLGEGLRAEADRLTAETSDLRAAVAEWLKSAERWIGEATSTSHARLLLVQEAADADLRSEMDTRIREIAEQAETRLKTTNERIDEQLRSAITDTNTRIDEFLSTRATELERRFEMLDARVTKIEERVRLVDARGRLEDLLGETRKGGAPVPAAEPPPPDAEAWRPEGG